MGMGGVQRTAKFAKYLHLFGWQPLVLTVTPKIYLASDNCLLNDVEKAGVKIFRTGSKNGINRNGISDTHKVIKFRKDSNRKLLSNISQTFLIPDSKILWKSKALQLAESIISENKVDLIYATAPPYTDFLIACELKEKFGIPIVLDYRDSWIDCPNNFYATPIHRNIHRKMETNVLEFADKIITINSRIKELILERYSFVNENNIVVIPQGFDPEDFQDNDMKTGPYKSKKMRITYSGSFLNYYTPKYFLDGMKIAFDKRPDLKDKIEACFIGTFPDEYKEYTVQLGIESAVNVAGYVEHSVCTQFLAESDVLWMMINRTGRSDLHSTGKLYEYFGAGKPIIACVPEGVARKSLEGYGAVTLTEPDDSPAIADAILKYYDRFITGTLPKPNKEMTDMYDRKILSGKLAEEFDSVLNLKPEEVKPE